MDVYTAKIPAYGRIKIDTGETVAYVNGDAPHLFLRVGSDAMRLPVGQCLPIRANYAELINPYPRDVDVLIGRGLPIKYAPEPSSYNFAQQKTIISDRQVLTLGAAGYKYGFGVIMNRGSAYFSIFDSSTTPDETRALIFPGASASFLAAKPALCMAEVGKLRGMDGAEDNSVTVICGTYTDQMVTDWIAAANYTATPVNTPHAVNRSYRVATDVAVFFTRPAGAAGFAHLQLTHLGADLGDYF